MSFRAGPVRSSRRQVRQQPYARPARAANAAPAAARRPERAQPSLFTRIKQFFWGSPAHEQKAPRMSEPPVLLGDDDELEFDPEQDGEHPSELQNEQDDAAAEELEASQYADIDSDTSTGSRIVHTSRSFSAAADMTPAVADGPNEALRHFFETKGDEELSNMEVVGVLSLIGQAVSRNESLVDFSQLSMDQRSDLDATANDTSVLRGLHAPPSPQLYRQGTPPPSSTRRAVDRSPWSSTPRRSSIRSRYSLAAAPPRRGSPATAPRPARPSGLRNSLSARADQQPQQPQQQQQQQQPLPRVTPAASAILQALDSESSPKRRVLATQRPSRISENDTTTSGFNFASPTSSTPSVSTPKPGDRLPASLLGKSSRSTETPIEKSTGSGINSESKFAEPAASSVNGGARQYSVPEPRALDTEVQEQPQDINNNNNNKENDIDIDIDDDNDDSAFAFEIPVSTAARELTPAEEAIVAETQSEFTF